MKARGPFWLREGGLFVLAAGTLLLIRGLADRNPYELVLGGASCVLWLGVFLAGFFAARRLALIQPGWISPAPLTAGSGRDLPGERREGAPHLITGLEAPAPWFFRLHFQVRGKLDLAKGRSYDFTAEAAASGDGPVRLAIGFPLSGIFHGTGRCRLRDVFGLFSFPCGAALHRSLPVLPAPFRRKPLLRIDPFSGAEDKQSRSQSDEERYYMREYAPGDRFRDINWKTSERLASLITRISPQTQEKTHVIHIAFRTYGPFSAPSLRALWILDRTKARLILFLRTLREEHPNFIFHIMSAGEERMVQTEEELDAFIRDMAGMPYAPFGAPGGGPAAQAGSVASGAETAGAGELYIFSTSYDTALPALILSRGDAPSYLYLTVPRRATGTFLSGGKTPAGREAPSGREAPHGGLPGESALYIRDILKEAFIPAPGFLSCRKVPVQAASPVPRRGGLDIEYAELRL
ncbi:MAG: DUF58 domain-containing protein [Spirochaetaceae bacterium]|jgi:hypothetical protein|nr:DUF58 domain-containing protein [Spirochaetaceae bacterium]